MGKDKKRVKVKEAGKKLLFLIITVALFSLPVFFAGDAAVAAGTVINDDFESDTVDKVPDGWIMRYNGQGDSMSKVVNDVSKNGNYSFKLDGVSSWCAAFYKTISNIDTNYTVEAYMRPESDEESGSISLYYRPKDTCLARVVFGYNEISYSKVGHDGKELVKLQNYTVGNWYHVKIVHDLKARTYNVYIDNVLKASNVNMYSDYTPNSLFLASGNSSGSDIIYFDDVKAYGLPLSTNTALSDLRLDGITVSGFNSGKLAYNVELPFGTAKAPTVTAAVYDTGKANAVVTQASALPGHASVLVTAEDGTTTQTYTINFTVAAPNTDATLSDLRLDGITVSDFNSGNLTYNVELPANTSKAPTVTATVSDIGKARTDITQAAALPGSASVLVTAEDGKTTQTYTINFTVAAPTPPPLSTDAALSDLRLDGNTISGFNPAILKYDVELPANTVAAPNVTAVVYGKATAVITQAPGLPGSVSVLVTAEDGKTTQTYTINFAVAAPTPPPLSIDAALSDLKLDGTTVSGFSSATLKYNVELPANTVAAPNVTAAVYGKATAVVTQAPTLPGSASVLVTAEDGKTTKTYTIDFTVATPTPSPLSTEATLSDLRLDGNTVSGFNPAILTYDVELPAGTAAAPNVTAAVYGKATAVITQAPTLPGHASILVTAEDGKTTKTYTVNFTVKSASSGGGRSRTDNSNTSNDEINSIITPHTSTQDDKKLDKQFAKTGKAEVLLENDAPVSELTVGVVSMLSKNNVPLTVKNKGVVMNFAPNSLDTTSQSEDNKVLLGAREVQDNEKDALLNNTPPGESTGLFEIGGKVFNLTAKIEQANSRGDEKTQKISFNEPVAITIDLSDLGELTEEQIAQLCGVRLEKDSSGQLIPVKLGGIYNPEDKTFTFYTDQFSFYTIMQAASLLQIKLEINQKNVERNGSPLLLDVAPQIINDRTMVPLRFISESMGADVCWDGDTRSVTITLEGKTLRLVIDQAGPGLDVPATIVNDRTLVPLRYISESLGAYVQWFPSSRSVLIIK